MAFQRLSEGAVFNSLTFLGYTGARDSTNSLIGGFRCSCGVEKTLRVSRVVRGETVSCGCALLTHLKSMGTHGMSKTRVFHIWQNMKYRCEAVTSKDFADYGAKGVTVSAEWQTFQQFYADMGEPPSAKHTIDRIRSAEGYSKANCRWATTEEQANNRCNVIKYDYMGEQLSAPQLYRVLKPPVGASTFLQRLRKGYSIPTACLRKVPKEVSVNNER